MRKIATTFLLICFGILIAFALCEITTRIIGLVKGVDMRLFVKELKNSDRLPSELFTPMRYGICLRPNVDVLAVTCDYQIPYSTNSHGLRDKEYDYDKPAGVYRILAFGDSFTFGEGVAYGERFTDIAESLSSDVEIINFGIPGNSLDHMLVEFIYQGSRYHPNAVILFVHRALLSRYRVPLIRDNAIDLSVVALQDFFAGGENTVYMSRTDPFFSPDAQRWWSHSYFIGILRYRLALRLLRRKMEEHDLEQIKVMRDREVQEVKRNLQELSSGSLQNTVPSAQQGVSAAGFSPSPSPDRIQASPAQPFSLQPPQVLSNKQDRIKADAGSADAFTSDEKRTTLLLKKFVDVCAQSGIKLVVVNCTHYGRLDYINNIDPRISFYDLSDEMNAEQKIYSLTFRIDKHYNPAANRFLAKKVLKIVNDLKTADSLMRDR